MATPLSIALHPEEVALGASLIVAAAGAVRRGGGVVAAWDFFHATNVPTRTDVAVAAMLQMAAAQLDVPCVCFRFRSQPLARALGLVPARGRLTDGEDGLLFEPALAALAADVAAGAAALVVSNGLRTGFAPQAPAPFLPGVLRLRPCEREVLDSREDAFAESGFPTLVVSDRVNANGRSAHEGLELCARLAARLASDLQAVERPPPRLDPTGGLESAPRSR